MHFFQLDSNNQNQLYNLGFPKNYCASLDLYTIFGYLGEIGLILSTKQPPDRAFYVFLMAMYSSEIIVRVLGLYQLEELAINYTRLKFTIH